MLGKEKRVEFIISESRKHKSNIIISRFLGQDTENMRRHTSGVLQRVYQVLHSVSSHSFE